VKGVGEPCAGEPHARFDGRGLETERISVTAPAPDPTILHRLAATVEAWWPAIEAGILTGYSNSRSEGYNRLAKHQGRNAFGFRNPVNQRRRIRWACTRQYRRASAVKTTLPG
jgi:transposase